MCCLCLCICTFAIPDCAAYLLSLSLLDTLTDTHRHTALQRRTDALHALTTLLGSPLALYFPLYVARLPLYLRRIAASPIHSQPVDLFEVCTAANGYPSHRVIFASVHVHVLRMLRSCGCALYLITVYLIHCICCTRCVCSCSMLTLAGSAPV